MDNKDLDTEPPTQNGGFIKHLSNFDNDTKCELLNIVQYVLLAIIPMTLLNYGISSVIPEPDESKSNIEISIELAGHLILILLGVFFVHRIVTYVPTYSGRAFGNMNLFSVILVLLVLCYESSTTVGKKTKILVERGKELWEGKKDDDKKKKNKDGSVVKVTQPISRGGMPTHQPSRADYINSHNKMVSPTQMLPPASQQEGFGQSNGASNSMYDNQGFNGLVGATHPGMMQEPAAANEGFGAFSSF